MTAHRFTARAEPVQGDGHRMRARIVGWGDVGHPYDTATGDVVEVTVERGGLVAAHPVLLAFDGHNGDPHRPNVVGTFAAAEGADGLYAEVDLNATPEAERLHHAARTGAPVAVSMEFDTDAEGTAFTLGPDTPATVTGLAILDRDPGAFQTAQVTLAAGKAPTMSDTPNDPTPEPEPGPEPDEPKVLAAVGAVRSEMAEMERRVMSAQTGGRFSARHPLDKFDSLESLTDAVRTGDRATALDLDAHFAAGFRDFERQVSLTRRFGAALVDQLTTENPGVVRPHYLTEIYGNIVQGRRVITSLGGSISVDKGMSVSWGYYDGDLTAIVAEQLAEKTAIGGAKISIKAALEALRTWAAGSDVSLQLAEQGSNYVPTHNQILTSAYNLTTDGVMADRLVADAGGYIAFDPAAATGEDAAKAAIAASVQVDLATGSPASTIIAGTNAFSALAIAFWSHAPAYGTQNTGGTSQASTLSVNVSGLEVVHAPMMDPDTAVVTNGLAARWGESGPHIIENLDVEKLGRNIAIWGLGAPLIFSANGIVVLAATAPVTASADAKGKGK